MDRLLTVPEVAKVLQVNPNKVNELINEGVLPCLVLGRRKVRESTLEKFMETYEGFDITNPSCPVRLERSKDEADTIDNISRMG